MSPLPSGPVGIFTMPMLKTTMIWIRRKISSIPKLGISWRLLEGTTLRGAVFRTLKRTLLTDQTLEPTQVAGFNQFYDDPDATDTWVYGGAVDQKILSKPLWRRGIRIQGSGGSVLHPTGFPGPFVREKADWEEYLGRAYLYWAPYKMLSLTAEYLYEKLDRAEEFTFGVKNLKTQRVPLGNQLFSPLGVQHRAEGDLLQPEGRIREAGRLWLQMNLHPERIVSGSSMPLLITACPNAMGFSPSVLPTSSTSPLSTSIPT